MFRAVPTGLAYAGIIFAFGFVLGTLRVLVVAPALGETAAVVLELPVMLFASWHVFGMLSRRRPVLRQGDRLVVAGVALASLLCLEWLLAITLFGREPQAMMQAYATVPGAIGLAGQVAFALIPMVRRTG